MLNSSPKYCVLASLSLITSSGLPEAIILPLDNIIALETQFKRSLAWWSQITTEISSDDWRFRIG